VVFVYLKPRYEGLNELLLHMPDAQAILKGGPGYETVSGMVFFYQAKGGALLVVQMQGLPQSGGSCPTDVFGFHIHAGSACTGNEKDPFANAGAHYNPKNCPHPAHAGDLPPLLGCRGYAFLAFFTDRFSVKEVIGKTMIVHRMPDDFTTQPSGNSGAKIACGQIVADGEQK
jgi:Cu-Zn family superoxide dismutase